MSNKVGSLGEYLREQRRLAQLSLRQLAEQTGVSNPYLSQIENGLRKPSAEVLQSIAQALRVSADNLYVRAGLLEEASEGPGAVERAILADTSISERDKRVLIDIYASFAKEPTFHGDAPTDPSSDDGTVPESASTKE